MVRKGFAGAAVPTTAVDSMTASSPGAGGTFTLASSVGWTFTTTPFVVVVERGLPTEEKILCSAITGAVVTVAERGYDSTTAAAHGPDATVLHVLDSLTVDEANAHANDQLGDPHSQYLLRDEAYYRHVQSTPAAAWAIPHNLGFRPNLVVLDSAGSMVIGDVVHVDANNVTVTFAAAFSGEANLS